MFHIETMGYDQSVHEKEKVLKGKKGLEDFVFFSFPGFRQKKIKQVLLKSTDFGEEVKGQVR